MTAADEKQIVAALDYFVLPVCWLNFLLKCSVHHEILATLGPQHSDRQIFLGKMIAVWVLLKFLCWLHVSLPGSPPLRLPEVVEDCLPSPVVAEAVVLPLFLASGDSG